MSPVKRLGAADAARGTGVAETFPNRFAGKVALVTGAGSGIGRATARRLAAEGAKVACLDVNEGNGAAVAAEIAADASGALGGSGAESPGLARAYLCDVTEEASVEDAVGAARAELGRISVVCNVAGIGGFSHTVDQSLEGWNRMLAVNLTGTFLVCRATLPGLLEGGGSITNVISTAGLMGQAYSAAYCASKGGVALLTKALAVEYVDRGVRVNGVAPGGVDTPLVHDFGFPEGADPRQFERIMTPMGYCTPAEVASAVAYLASEEASYASGTILAFDGALSA